MPNKKLFSTHGAGVAVATARNKAGGKAYDFSKEHELAQGVVTSTFNGTFYANEADILDRVLALANQCSPEFVAKVAVYGHEVAKMKDTPALLAAVLMTRGEEGVALLRLIFPRVITNAKMLRNFVQFVRSGKVGRRSFGSAAKHLIHDWFASRTGNQLFTGSIGAEPSIGDIIKMVHPRPESPEKAALYAYLIGRPHEAANLPPKVRDYENFKTRLTVANSGKMIAQPSAVPDVPFQMLASLPLTEGHWRQIALNLPWNALRMNLNTLARHGCFKDRTIEDAVVTKLRDPEEVRKNNVFPYQLLTAFQNIDEGVPARVRNALQDAMEVATENVPSFGCSIAACIDTSGSMSYPATGMRQGSTTKTKLIDIAALVGATLIRKNEDSILLPFDVKVHATNTINSRDSIMTVASQLSRYGGGGTDCASALRVLNGLAGRRPKVVIYVSDNESWYSPHKSTFSWGSPAGTTMAIEWDQYKRRTPGAKLVCIDLVPHGTTQVVDAGNVLNIGGFSDRIWPTIERFVKQGNMNFVDMIHQSISLEQSPIQVVIDDMVGEGQGEG